MSAALVTGGSRGIGRAVCRKLAQAGVGVLVINYLENHEAAAAAQREVEALGAVAHPVAANLAHPAEIDRLFARVSEITPRIDVLVHAAASWFSR